MARRQNFAVDLLSNAGAGAGDAVSWPGGRLAATGVATGFGTGGTDIEILGPDGTTWIAISDLNFTANAIDRAFVPAGQIRANAGAGASGVYIRATWMQN